MLLCLREEIGASKREETSYSRERDNLLPFPKHLPQLEDGSLLGLRLHINSESQLLWKHSGVLEENVWEVFNEVTVCSQP